MDSRKPVFKRVMLKLSGEALMGQERFGLDPQAVAAIADEIVEVTALGVEVAIVVGGGNIFRGMRASQYGMERVAGDHMGMLATVINGLALQDFLEKRDTATRVLSAIEMREVAEPYIRRRAIRHLEKGRVVIFAAGTGNPYFTTDSAASLRAMEVHAEVILKATKVDGIYSADPKLVADAVKFETITFQEVLEKGLKVMDATAIAMCMDHALPIIIFDITTSGNLKRVVLGEPIGSTVREG